MTPIVLERLFSARLVGEVAKKLVDDLVKGRILALAGEGMGVNAIARKLKAEKLPGAASQVSGVLRASREAANAGQGAPALPALPSPPPASGDAAAGEDVAGLGTPEHEARAARGELAEADAIHERLRVRLRLLGDRVDSEFKKPAPDWSLLRSLIAAERSVRDEVIASRPVAVRKPEDDPCNLEMARSTTDTLLARIEAAENARQRATT